MKQYLPLIALLTASACGTVQTLPVQDSTVVNVRTGVQTIHDTAYVELPVIVERVATLDTTSTLENKYAKSEAVVSGGILHHSLETKAVKQPIPVESKIVYRDSLVYRDRIQTRTIEVEKKLSGWQIFKMKLGLVAFVALLLAIAYVIYLIFNHFLNLKHL